jgi:hypothetical protein
MRRQGAALGRRTLCFFKQDHLCCFATLEPVEQRTVYARRKKRSMRDKCATNARQTKTNARTTHQLICYAKGKAQMNEAPSTKKKGISLLQRLSILAVLGIVLAVIFNFLR